MRGTPTSVFVLLSSALHKLGSPSVKRLTSSMALDMGIKNLKSTFTLDGNTTLLLRVSFASTNPPSLPLK
jgi:hypothetical protein